MKNKKGQVGDQLNGNNIFDFAHPDSIQLRTPPGRQSVQFHSTTFYYSKGDLEISNVETRLSDRDKKVLLDRNHGRRDVHDGRIRDDCRLGADVVARDICLHITALFLDGAAVGVFV